MGDWVIDFEAKLNNRRNAQSQEEQRRKKRSIHRLPPLIISDLNKKAYEPEVVSFGPYHHEEPRLMPMEDHKHRALLYFLDRTRVPLNTIFKSMVGVEQDLKDSYDSLQPVWQNDTKKFMKLMILDGCFMLEILQAAAREARGDYSLDDPIFGPHGKLHAMPFIKRDMLLLENQLPLLVLIKLTSFEEEIKGDTEALNKLILKFYGHDHHSSEMGKCLHILDLYRKSLLYEEPKSAKSTRQNDGSGLNSATVRGGSSDEFERELASRSRNYFSLQWYKFQDRFRRELERARASAGCSPCLPPPNPPLTTVVRSATELKEAGICFKRSRSKSLKDISFKCGVLRLPTFVVDDATESTFLNLIAFERCHVGVGHDITSFICFMDRIIDHDRDISLLSSKEIILNVVGSDNVAADLFNTMPKDLVLDPFSNLNRVHDNIVAYCKNPGPKWRAMLIHNYFKSPWSIISVVAAVILFILTTVSTVYDVKGK